MADSSDKVFIWSDEHNAYWRPNGAGYTVRIGGAGLYDRAEAENILRGVNPEKRLVIEEIPEWARASEAEVYNRAIEDAAKACEDQRQDFLSPEYTTGQPLGSFSERFACGECAASIRALAKELG